jgi:hypothetical protein
LAVSYTVIGNLGAGLMGIRPLPSEQSIESFPQLTTETGWAALHHVPVGSNVIAIKHIRNNQTALTNESGPALYWRAAFPGTFHTLLSGGNQIPAIRTLRSDGSPETCAVIHVGRGETRVVQTSSG